MSRSLPIKASREDLKEHTGSLSSSFTLPNLLLAAGFVAVVVLLTLLYLGGKSLGLDEAISVAIVRSGWPTFWKVISHGEANMGLYYVLLKLWMILGESEFAIRSLSAIFAVLTVPTIFALGYRLYNKRTGLLAALLVTVNPFFIQYAQEARGYSLGLFLASLSTLLFVEIIRRPSKWTWAVYAIVSGLAVYAHALSAFILAAHAVSLLFTGRWRAMLKGFLISWLATAGLVFPLALNILTTSAHNLDWITRPGIKEFVIVFWDFTKSMPLLVLLFVLCLAALVYALKQWSISKAAAWHDALVLAWLFLPIILVFGISQVKPVFASRYFIICLPPLVILAALGISRIPVRWLSIAGIVVVLALSGLQLRSWYTDYEKEDWRGATEHVLSLAEQGDAIIFYSPDTGTGFDYYESRLPASVQPPAAVPYFDASNYQELNPVFDIPFDYSPGGRQPEPDRALAARLASYSRVWLVLSHDQIHNSKMSRDEQSRMLQDLLQARYGTPAEKDFHLIRVFLYTPGM